ncbi:H-type small acid-soluble spore protein [Virgibacillus sp. C22-A2]|uniref:Small, acid-soluble spore protein H n=1 Tax=Virgibacillus tibetensis TaxID=3042313 RepID=A0ABU6KGC6_9BACI|nr:H-type small acid-soluble spore protein [Virgibacillus sp. C22-A2]
MDTTRAEEIINSTNMINVNYHGIPVYIQTVNSNSETATVFPLDEMNNEQEVDVDGLFETGP